MSKRLHGRLLPALMISVLTAAACTSAEDPEQAASATKPNGQEAAGKQTVAGIGQGRWIISNVGGKAAVDSAAAWLEVDLAAGRITGNAGCNDFFASFEGTPEAVKMGPVGGTKKMCPGEPMVQETAVYAVLAGVSRIYVDDQGRLVLEGSSGNLLASAAP